MLHKHPDLATTTEITEINREFLRLMTQPRSAAADGATGLGKAVRGCLRRLTPAQLDWLATVPALLVEFSPPVAGELYPDHSEQMVKDAGVESAWDPELDGYANRLLAFVWQAARHSVAGTAVRLGLDRGHLRQLAELSFTRLSRSDVRVTNFLRARFADHPTFWPDLLRAARSDDPELRLATRLAIIQLSVSRRQPNAGSAARTHSYS